MQVKQIMSTHLITVKLDDSLEHVKSLFDGIKFHHLLVVENKKLKGVISDRDLFKAVSPHVGTVSETDKDRASLRKKAHQIMTRKIISLPPEADFFEALSIFVEKGVSCIPIINDEHKPLGIVSWRDLLRVLEARHNQNKK